MPECRVIALFLQIEADLIHAARRVDRKYELKVHLQAAPSRLRCWQAS